MINARTIKENNVKAVSQELVYLKAADILLLHKNFKCDRSA